MTTDTIKKADAGKYLTFFLANEQFGIAIIKVKEIIGYQEITEVPQTPHEVKGILNLRGEVVPIVDLRLRFGIEEAEVTEDSCIIVVEIAGHNDNIVSVGIIVDGVSVVQDITDGQIEPPPALGDSNKTDFITGMAKADDTVKILLDIEKVLMGVTCLDFNICNNGYES